MANHNLTDLLPDWHPIPDGGGLVRKGERYAIVESEGRIIDGMPMRPRRAMSALETLRVTLNSIPRHAMGGKRARALNSTGLGCTAEPRRAR